MRDVGQIYSVIVYREGSRFRLVDGMHRWTAAHGLGWVGLRCDVYTSKDMAVAAIQLHTCQVQKHMTPWEEHVFFARLCNDQGVGFEALCKLTRKSESYVSYRLNIGNLQPETQEALQKDAISFGVAKELMRVKDRNMELYFLDTALRSGCGTVVVRTWVSQWLQKQTLVTGEQVVAPVGTALPPPVPVELTCALCGGPPEGDGMCQVWVHVSELQQVAKAIGGMFRQSRAAEVVPPPAPPSQVEG
jgi:hypothetical protein